MQVTREVIKKVPHIITDYDYNGDNIGINLNLLNEEKTRKVLEIDGIAIDYSPVSFNNTNNRTKITTTLEYDNKVDKIQVIAEVLYRNEISCITRNIEDEVFANDIINTCLINKKNIKNMDCYKQSFDSIVEQVKENALEIDFLVKTQVLPYKCYIYSNNMELLGIANRLMEKEDSYILGEYVGKKLVEYIDKNIYIDVCVNNEITLQFSNVKVADTFDASLSYAVLNMDNTMIKRLTENYSNIELNIPNGFNFPEYKIYGDINYYYEELLKINSPSNIEKFYKINKVKANNTIDINKYLIW